MARCFNVRLGAVRAEHCRPGSPGWNEMPVPVAVGPLGDVGEPGEVGEGGETGEPGSPGRGPTPTSVDHHL